MSKKKKIIIAVCAAVCVAVAALVIVLKTTATKEPTHGDIQDTPLPVSIDISSAKDAPAKLRDVKIHKEDLPNTETEDNVTLFNKNYSVTSYNSTETFINDNGVKVAKNRYIEYFGENKELLFTSVVPDGCSNIYDKTGKLIYSDGNYTPEASYDAEPVHWFYKNGKLAAAELFFYDLDDRNVGAAYYDGDGNLLGTVTEVYTHKGKDLVIKHAYYDSAFAPIEQADFESLIPQVDAPDFFYINWSNEVK